MFSKLFGKFSRDLGVDLGTANTLVLVRDKGIVVNEPSVVAINARTDQILAVGHEAKDMLGKTPPYILTSRPLVHGVIADFEVAEKMLRFFISKVYERAFAFVPRPRVVIGVPLGTTEVERKAVEDVMLSAGAREVALVEEPMAAAIGARLPIEDPISTMIVDIGGGTTDIAVISLGGIVTWKSIGSAGDEMNKNIVNYAREKFGIYLGETHAELVKIKIGSAEPLPQPLELPVRGRDALTGLPKEVLVSDADVREALGKTVKNIVDTIKAVLETTPPELTADIHERGIVLCGGGALLRGIDRVITRETEVPIHIADDPLTCVVRGAGILLERGDLLATVRLPSARTGVR